VPAVAAGGGIIHETLAVAPLVAIPAPVAATRRGRASDGAAAAAKITFTGRPR